MSKLKAFNFCLFPKFHFSDKNILPHRSVTRTFRIEYLDEDINAEGPIEEYRCSVSGGKRCAFDFQH